MQFFQSHEQNGYRARITIEWSAPDDIELLPDRAGMVESLAAEALDKTFKAPIEIVAAMLGKSLAR